MGEVIKIKSVNIVYSSCDKCPDRNNCEYDSTFNQITPSCIKCKFLTCRRTNYPCKECRGLYDSDICHFSKE